MAIIDIRSSPNFKQTVLLLDDQPMVLSIHEAIIKSLDLDLMVIAKTDPIEALAYLRKRQVDLLITDFRMHGIDGIRFLMQAKYFSLNSYLRIVVITALRAQKTYEAILATGVAKCLFKPARSEELANISYALLNRDKSTHLDNNASGNANA